MPPTLEDVLLGVDLLLAPAMHTAGFARIEVAGHSRSGVGMELSKDPVTFLREHGGRFPEVRWWYRGWPRGRIEIVMIGFEHNLTGDEQWLEYDSACGALDTSAWFAPRSAGAADSRDRVESVDALHQRLRLAAQEVETAR